VGNATVLDHERTLDLRTGLLYRRTVFQDADGRRPRLETLRCARSPTGTVRCASDHAGEPTARSP
jgi:trehalose/maltose hydrolase-like predicted phosphorylase